MQPELGQIIYADLTSCVWFGSIFPKKAWIILCKTGPDLIWMTWPGFGQTDLVWKQANVQESQGMVLAECNWLATSFPFSDSVAFFHRWPRSYCAMPAQIWFCSGRLCEVLFGQMDLVLKRASVQDSLNPSQAIQTGCRSDLAGLLGLCLTL